MRRGTAFTAFVLVSLWLAPQAASAQNAPWGPPVAPSVAGPPTPTWGAYAGPAPTPRCLRSDTGARIGMELLAGFGTGAVILAAMIGAVLTPSSRAVREETVLPVVVLGGVGLLVLQPLAIYLVGNAYGGDGSYTAAFVGNLLFGFIGATIGYELSTSPSCPSTYSLRRTPHPRRVSAWTATPRIAPFILPPVGAEGASAGLTLRF